MQLANKPIWLLNVPAWSVEIEMPQNSNTQAKETHPHVFVFAFFLFTHRLNVHRHNFHDGLVKTPEGCFADLKPQRWHRGRLRHLHVS